jgi:Protein of unknown function (DUF2934)
MAKAKSPRPSSKTVKQVITMPEAGSVSIKKSVATTSPSQVRSASPDLEGKIRQRAYELYEERGRTTGRDQEDWFRAELEVVGGLQNHKQSA